MKIQEVKVIAEDGTEQIFEFPEGTTDQQVVDKLKFIGGRPKK